MNLLNKFYAFIILTILLPSLTQAGIIGHIDSVVIDQSKSQIKVSGWACDQGKRESIKVHLYLGGGAGSKEGKIAAISTANLSSEKAVGSRCKTSGIRHRFQTVLSESIWKKYQGKKVYIHGISVSKGTNLLIYKSGSFSLPPRGNIRGNIDGITIDENARQVKISGWACDEYNNKSIQVHTYLDGGAARGKMVASTTSNRSSEAAVRNICKTSGVHHRFQVVLNETIWRKYVGKKVYIHGISVSNNQNSLIGKSGDYTLPAVPKRIIALSEYKINTNANFTVPANTSVRIDKNIVVGHLNIKGNLLCPSDNKTYTIVAKAISVYGKFDCGSNTSTFNGNLNLKIRKGVELSGPYGAMGERSIIVHSGGALSLYGNRSRAGIVKLSKTVGVNSNTIEVNGNTSWKVGDKVVVSSTSFDMNEAERVTIKKVINSRKYITHERFKYVHYGNLQNFRRGAKTFTLDERASVANLTRNIKIYPIEGDHTTDKLGAHLMVMPGGKAYIDSVEFINMGRMGEMARYPMHWHMLGNANGQFIKNSVIRDSYQRCVTIHDTNNVLVENNVCYNHFGHGFFLEDGSEVGNILRGNLGLVTKTVPKAKALLISDYSGVAKRFPGPSTYWISNPKNSIYNNIAGGSNGSGFWMAFEDREICNRDACSNPQKSDTKEFHHNTAISSRVGITWDGAPGTVSVGNPNNPGDRKLVNAHYSPVNKPVFNRIDAFKQREAGIYFRGNSAKFTNSILADNVWSLFLAYSQHFQDTAIIGRSANFGTKDLRTYSQYNGSRHVGVVLYDGPFEMERVSFFNFSTKSEEFEGRDITSVPMYSIGGANRYENRVKGLFFSPEPLVRVDLKDYNVGWKDSNITAMIRDIDGSLSGTTNAIVVPKNSFNYHSSCRSVDRWGAYVCKYDIAVLSFRNYVNNNDIFFDVKSPNGNFHRPNQNASGSRYHNKFGMNLNYSKAIYEIYPKRGLEGMKKILVITHSEKQNQSTSVAKIVGLGNCSVTGLGRKSSITQLRDHSSSGYYSNGQDLFVKFITKNRHVAHKYGELSNVHVAVNQINCN